MSPPLESAIQKKADKRMDDMEKMLKAVTKQLAEKNKPKRGDWCIVTEDKCNLRKGTLIMHRKSDYVALVPFDTKMITLPNTAIRPLTHYERNLLMSFIEAPDTTYYDDNVKNRNQLLGVITAMRKGRETQWGLYGPHLCIHHYTGVYCMTESPKLEQHLRRVTFCPEKCEAIEKCLLGFVTPKLVKERGIVVRKEK